LIVRRSKPVVDINRDQDRVSCFEGNFFTIEFKHAVAIENVVDLLVCVGWLVRPMGVAALCCPRGNGPNMEIYSGRRQPAEEGFDTDGAVTIVDPADLAGGDVDVVL
jgi:hypothetical protein